MSDRNGIIRLINGPVVKADNMTSSKMREMVMVGNNKLIGEVIGIDGDIATVQVYEETEGVMAGEKVVPTGQPLSVKVGPGLMQNIFDGIERPLQKLDDINKNFIAEGIGLISLDLEKKWDVIFTVKVGDKLEMGDIFAELDETSVIKHYCLVPPYVSGEVVEIKSNGQYNIEETVMKLKDANGNMIDVALSHDSPIRKPRPVKERLAISRPLLTGQRVLDVFFPIAKGGTAAIPGGFGTGKTMTQHQIAKWSDADIIVYIGCGERGNEMTDVLQEFPHLIDPKTGKVIMERTVLIANTSNMPVAAREASVYTGVTIAEYYRDMGYHVAIMADSTSRWAEALREISGRLEEMPAEEGYPAYLSSRLAEFYERAGYVITNSGKEGSVTIIGAVSPAGSDFSEPVTENTKRFVNAFLALDKKLAYARHYPSINWLNSYSGYVNSITKWYQDNVSEGMMDLRAEMLKLLYEENKLLDIVQLVGEDVLPDDQRLVLEIARVIKSGFLQQNAYHKEDTYVPLPKQHLMLELIKFLYDRASEAVALGAPISEVKNDDLFAEVTKMKYTIPNDNITGIGRLRQDVDDYYTDLISKYRP